MRLNRLFIFPGTFLALLTSHALVSSVLAEPNSATQPAAPVTTNSATLNGMAVPNGLDSVAWFEWGTNGVFSEITTPTSLGNGLSVVRVSASLSGLEASRSFSSRLVVSNSAGATRGWEQRFVTGGKVVGWGAADGRAAVPGNLRDAVAISSFGTYGLALRAGGSVVGWGPPQIGVSVPAELSNVIAIAAGTSHNLALRSDGTVVSWGSRTNVPAGLSNVIAVAAGGLSMALKADGTVAMWSSTGTLVTNTISGLSNVVAISAGSSGYLALRSDGAVAASGGPSLPGGLTNIAAISSGPSHHLALRTNGTVIAWGPFSSFASVVVPSGLSNVVVIAGGANHDLALKADGSFGAWGKISVPSAYVPVGIGSNVCAIACGAELGLALRPLSAPDFQPFAHTQSASPVTTNSATLNGTVVANGLETQAWFEWGASTNYGNTTSMLSLSNEASVVRCSAPISGLAAGADCYYRLVASNSAGVKVGFGLRLTTGRKVSVWGTLIPLGTPPQPPPGLGPVTKIASGHIFTLALRPDGHVVGWGDPFNGGATNIPASLTNAVEIGGGYSHGLAIREDRTVVTWGKTINGADNGVPPDLTNVIAVAGGDSHSLALRSDGSVVTWGTNFNVNHGQTNTPVGLVDAVAISAGAGFSAALRADGSVIAWGDSSSTSVPTNLNQVVAISSDAWHTLALKEDGKVVAFGDFVRASGAILQQPNGLSNVVAVAAGASHSAVLKSDNTVVVWGENTYGQKLVPIGLSNVVGIASGDWHSLALAPNAQPQATNASIIGLANIDLTIALPVFDPNNDPIAPRVSTIPAAGSLYQYAAGSRGNLIVAPDTIVTDAGRRVIFAPAIDAFGAPYSTFGVVASEAEADSVVATVTVNIIPAFSVNTGLPGIGLTETPFSLNFGGFTNLTYRIWASTNLTNWSVLGSATQATPGLFQFIDLPSTNLPRRFYRVSSP